VITLKDVLRLESKQIAASLEISDALVRQRLHRGRQALLTLMTPHMEGTP
jgi:DNA-directed RNA polymerase specialized sigma24 family protein